MTFKSLFAVLCALILVVHGRRAPSLELSTAMCSSYETLVQDVYDKFGGNISWEHILEVAEEACSLLPNPAERIACKIVAAEMVEIGESLDLNLQRSYSPYMICTILSLCSTNCCLMPTSPEQVHVALTGDPTELVVSWATASETSTPMAQFGLDSQQYTMNYLATTHTYAQGGW